MHMKKKHKFILGTVAILIVVGCCIGYSQYQRYQRSNEYAYELLKVKSSLEQIVQYSQNCIESITSGEREETHGELMQSVTELDWSVSRIALLYTEGNLSRYIFELSDHLNGTYPHLSNDTKVYWLQSIQNASKEFLTVLESNSVMSIYDFRTAVRSFSTALPTYEG